MMNSDYSRVEKAIRFLEAHAQTPQPPLAAVAAHVGLSEFHFQRLFQRWAGVSPKRFLQFQALGEAKRLLQSSRSVLEASLASGLSGPGRLHDLFLRLEAMTPGEFKSPETVVRHGVHGTPFGDALFAATDRGLCALTFLEDGAHALDKALDDLRRRLPHARHVQETRTVAPLALELRKRVAGESARPFPLLVRGSDFQLKVWEALLRIPAGAVATYGGLARALGTSNAARAVGSAVGQNPIAVLIPCHRVIQSTGVFGGYRWGETRKRAILAMEFARAAG